MKKPKLIYFSEKEIEIVEEIAKKREITFTAAIRLIIEKYLELIEDKS